MARKEVRTALEGYLSHDILSLITPHRIPSFRTPFDVDRGSSSTRPERTVEEIA